MFCCFYYCELDGFSRVSGCREVGTGQWHDTIMQEREVGKSEVVSKYIDEESKDEQGNK